MAKNKPVYVENENSESWQLMVKFIAFCFEFAFLVFVLGFQERNPEHKFFIAFFWVILFAAVVFWIWLHDRVKWRKLLNYESLKYSIPCRIQGGSSSIKFIVFVSSLFILMFLMIWRRNVKSENFNSSEVGVFVKTIAPSFVLISASIAIYLVGLNKVFLGKEICRIKDEAGFSDIRYFDIKKIEILAVSTGFGFKYFLVVSGVGTACNPVKIDSTYYEIKQLAIIADALCKNVAENAQIDPAVHELRRGILPKV